mmetsp:Transcript_10804/g.28866  ORF Transcript_10804/g.28866 Transcript_10804/m.28866 type:complete len:233 (+) Transcript_10804:1883-2581(+)
MPNWASGLSFEFFCWFVRGLPMPLLHAHSTILLSLSSMCFSCVSMKVSSQSNVPSSGREIGNTTSYCLAPGLASGNASTSACAASCNIRHLNGSGNIGWTPKWTCRVTFRKDTCGYSVLPLSASGSGMGFVARLPPLNRLTVSAFGCPFSRFNRTPTTCSRPKRAPPGLLLLSAVKKPSASKHTPSSSSPSSRVEALVEKPTRTCCFGVGAWWPRRPPSPPATVSKILASKK